MKNKADNQELLEQIKAETGLELALHETDDPEQDRAALERLLKTLRSASSRPAFLRGLLLEQWDESELRSSAARLHLEESLPRALLLIRFEKAYSPDALSVLGHLYNAASCDVLQMDGKDVVLIRTLKASEAADLPAMAREVLTIIQTEALLDARVAYDRPAAGLFDLPAAYRSAALAMEIGGTFYADRRLYDLGELGLGSLLYQLPKEACAAYLERSLPQMDFREMDAETLNTIRTFLDCDLNIAETARALYMHRNTLVYRLETLKKQTGLDIRRFDDAMRCRIGLLLWKML